MESLKASLKTLWNEFRLTPLWLKVVVCVSAGAAAVAAVKELF